MSETTTRRRRRFRASRSKLVGCSKVNQLACLSAYRDLDRQTIRTRSDGARQQQVDLVHLLALHYHRPHWASLTDHSNSRALLAFAWCTCNECNHLGSIHRRFWPPPLTSSHARQPLVAIGGWPGPVALLPTAKWSGRQLQQSSAMNR